MMKQILYRLNPRWRVGSWRSKRWSLPVKWAGPSYEAFAEWDIALGLAQCGLFGDALAHANAMFRIATEIDDPQRISGAYYALGYSYLLMLLADPAIQNLELGLSVAKEFGSSWMIGNTTTELVSAYLLNDQPVRARTLLDSVPLQETGHHTRAERRMLWAKGNLFLAENKPAEALRIAGHLLELEAQLPANAADPSLVEARRRGTVRFEAIQESRAQPGTSQTRCRTTPGTSPVMADPRPAGMAV